MTSMIGLIVISILASMLILVIYMPKFAHRYSCNLSNADQIVERMNKMIVDFDMKYTETYQSIHAAYMKKYVLPSYRIKSPELKSYRNLPGYQMAHYTDLRFYKKIMSERVSQLENLIKDWGYLDPEIMIDRRNDKLDDLLSD